MPFTDGPFIQVACFCEQVITATDNTLSLIRIVDTLTHHQAGPNPPTDMPPFPAQLKLVISLKSGRALGRHEVKMVPDLPNGETDTPAFFTVHFKGEEQGHNIILQFSYVFKFEGLYWFNILIDNEKITAIPLRTRYNRVVITSAPQAPPA